MEMTNLEIIQEIKQSTFTDEDGEQYQLEFQSPVSEEEIEHLRKRFPNHTIADEIVQILKVTRGWDGFGPEMVYFDAIDQFGFTELSPHSITLGHDGFGNNWILDISANGNLGKVFFACHDPAVFMINSQNVNQYLNHLLEFYKTPSNSHLTTIEDQTVIEAWRNNTNLISKNDFQKMNPGLSAFLNRFEGEDWSVADLRKGNNKEGFPWGKLGPNQLTKRHPTELIWIIKNKKRGILSKILGK